MMSAMTEIRAELPAGLAQAWGFTTTGTRGPKPAHSVERIVETAIELADAEGFAALSLPKIAKRLGFTTNALYRYITSKDELLVLLRDAGWGEPPTSVRLAEGWRDAAAAWVHGYVERTRQHPWLLDVPVRGAPVTPHVLRWLEVLLAALKDTGLRERDTLDCALLLDGYARSTAMLARDLHQSTDPPVQSAAVGEFLMPLLLERGFPLVARMLSGGGYEDGEIDDHDIDFGLHRILDGIEVLIERRANR
jgi:AcrR family transcriptional regulator